MKCSVHFLALSSEFRRVKRLPLFLASPLGSEQPKQLPKQASVVPSCAQDGPGVPDFFLGFNSGAKKKSFCRLTRLERSLPLETPTRRRQDAFQLPAAAAASFAFATRLHLFFD